MIPASNSAEKLDGTMTNNSDKKKYYQLNECFFLISFYDALNHTLLFLS